MSDIEGRILEAARALFLAQGYAGTPLRAIAREAGTSESGVLRIFGSKSGVLQAVYASCWGEVNRQIDEALRAAAARDQDPRYLLVELMRALLELHQNQTEMFVFLNTYFAAPELGPFSPLAAEAPDPSSPEGQFRSYLGRIEDLCRQVLATCPEFAAAGITQLALREFVASTIYGTQMGWLLAGKDAPNDSKLAVAEATRTLAYFLHHG